MLNKSLKILIIILSFILVTACSKKVKEVLPSSFSPININQIIRDQEFEKKIDHLMIILDLSVSMDERIGGVKKYKKAIELLDRMSQSIPDLEFDAAIRTFGNYECSLCKTTKLIYGPKKYSRDEFMESLNNIKGANGESPLDKAIDNLSIDLYEARGNIALIIISDFKEISNSSIAAAMRLNKRFENRLTSFILMLGNDPLGKKFIKKLADATGNSFSIMADSIYSNQNMSDFVRMAFLKKTLDSDKDGVSDEEDECPKTPFGVNVDEMGCPIDTDGDGVWDNLDKCPDTLPELKADSKGCPLDLNGDGIFDYIDNLPQVPPGVSTDDNGRWIINKLNFDIISPVPNADLESAVSAMKKYTDFCYQVHVYNKTTKSKKCNKILAEYQGNEIKKYIVDKKIEPRKIALFPYGLSEDEEEDKEDKRVQLKMVPCIKDSDNDGVSDRIDKCPNTPENTMVDEKGCPFPDKDKVSIEMKIQFDSNQAIVKPEYFPQIKKVADFLKRYPDTSATIQAHTDSQGSELFNHKLSQKRAESVVKILIEQYNIESQRLNPIGFGESKPIADNKTKEGRQKNRRAIAVITAIPD